MVKKSGEPAIKLSRLKELARQGKLTKKQLGRYFIVKEKSGAEGPVLNLNSRTVDLGKAAPSPDEVRRIHALAMGEAAVTSAKDARSAKSRKRIAASAKTGAAAPTEKVRIVVEGDSWFRLPFWYPKDVVDYLKEDFDVNPLAMWGDTLENIFAQKQYLQVLGGGLRRHLLLSGGGNDVLGSIHKYVDERKSNDTDPSTASKYVRPQFGTVVNKLVGYYRDIVAEVRAEIDVPVVIYLHGYADAIAQPGGKYLGVPLGKRGFDPVVHEGMCAEIVRHMVKLFNDGLAQLASSRAGVVYVDLRPAFVSPTDWHKDEIHPSAKGARKAATALRKAINANLH